MYQQRLLLYVDILGWTAALRKPYDPRLLKAVELVHVPAGIHNERYRQECLSQDGEDFQVMPMFLEVQFGAFSDHFVYSLPESFGPRIVTIASKLIVDLLRIGWLTRGGIVLGQLYHKDNMVFGPALLEAIEIEEQRAIYPRILISDEALKLFGEWEWDPRHKIQIKDQHGAIVVNPFALPFAPTGENKDVLIESFVDLNYGFKEIKPMLERELSQHTQDGRAKEAAKWAYLREFITGPIFREEPLFAKLW